MAELVRNVEYGHYTNCYPWRSQRWLVLVGGTAPANVVVVAFTKRGALKKLRRWQKGQHPERVTVGEGAAR